MSMMDSKVMHDHISLQIGRYSTFMVRGSEWQMSNVNQLAVFLGILMRQGPRFTMIHAN